MIRYRSEDTYGEGHRDIVEVMEYETFELENTDIIDTLGSTYFSDDSLESLTFRSLVGNQFCSELTALDSTTFCERVLELLNRKTGKDLKYCLWLADLEAVLELYEGVNVDAYETSGVVLSDLGYDGSLYAYEELPTPLP